MDNITKEDLVKLKMEILREIGRLTSAPQKILKFLNSAEVRRTFQISETKLYELRRDGKIPFLKVDGKYLYDYSELLNAFKNQT